MIDQPRAYCKMVARNPGISNATARFGAWLIGAADIAGGFPLELTTHQIREGFSRNGVDVKGLGGRYETINASISWLESHGYLKVTEGRKVSFGFNARSFTMSL